MEITDLSQNHSTHPCADSGDCSKLIRENNGQTQKTYTWTYDSSGNITSRREYAYTTGELGSIQNNAPYTYNDSQWGDLLSSYGGMAITYDTIGNPVSYNGWTFNWQHGRQLASMTYGSVTWSYTYDANGMRTSRTNGTTTYNYVYNGDKLTQMTKGSTKLTFTYDASGTPLTVTYNGTRYYYKTNLQGDVIGILDSSGTVVVTYVYDAWGRIRSKSGSLVDTLGFDNPLRYRGYVYDVQTDFYYLQSRYYYPIWGRFINADAFPSTGQSFTGNNMFAYCGNNPVTRKDADGYAWETIFDVLSLGASIMEVAFNPADPFAWMGLAGDAVDLIPFVTGVGETIRALKTVSRFADGADEAIDTYRNLRKLTKGSDLEVHHIVEKRFKVRAKISIDNTDDMFSIALSKADHKAYTDEWRKALPYGNDYRKKQVLQAAIEIYAKDPRLLGAAIFTIVN